jgi:hypothetical protein
LTFLEKETPSYEIKATPAIKEHSLRLKKQRRDGICRDFYHASPKKPKFDLGFIKSAKEEVVALFRSVSFGSVIEKFGAFSLLFAIGACSCENSLVPLSSFRFRPFLLVPERKLLE